MKQTKKSAKKFVVANWKMHGNLKQNQGLLESYVQTLSNLKHTQVVVCAPYPYLAQLQNMLANTHIAWGAQNVAKNETGPFTGEVSAEMLRDFCCEYVIIGHSERATAYCESDENIAQKFMVAKQHGLTPILCVGETLIEREAGVMEMVVGKQLDAIINTHGAALFVCSGVAAKPVPIAQIGSYEITVLAKTAAPCVLIMASNCLPTTISITPASRSKIGRASCRERVCYPV